jgi:ABC-2 type transport system ATP-binding protein
VTLQIRELAKTYANGVRGLKGVSLHIDQGLFGLLGNNGAGKSTLLRILATLIVPDSGQVLLDGQDVLKTPDVMRRALGYLPQDFGVYPRTSAEAMLEHLAALKGYSRKSERSAVVADLLRKVNLFDARMRRLDEFSGGMKRRFGIAQALLGDPRLIIVDEPTAGLDPSERNRFHLLLSEIAETRTVIFATHILEDVSSLCRDLAILARGELVAAGSPDAIIAPYIGKIWSARVRPNKAQELAAALPVTSVLPYRGDTIVHVYSDGQPTPEFEQKAVTLEDAYFAALSQTRGWGGGAVASA